MPKHGSGCSDDSLVNRLPALYRKVSSEFYTNSTKNNLDKYYTKHKNIANILFSVIILIYVEGDITLEYWEESRKVSRTL